MVVSSILTNPCITWFLSMSFKTPVFASFQSFIYIIAFHFGKFTVKFADLVFAEMIKYHFVSGWSAPSAVGIAGLGGGLDFGAEVRIQSLSHCPHA